MPPDMVGRTPLVGINKTVAYQAGECISRHMRLHNIQRLARAAPSHTKQAHAASSHTMQVHAVPIIYKAGTNKASSGPGQ